MAKFKIEHFKNLTATLRDVETDECMHSSVGAWNEAQLLYIQQSQLHERLIFSPKNAGSLLNHSPVPLSEGSGLSPLVLYDVGLGIGANAIAAIQTLKELPQDEIKRPLHLISFEKYPEGMVYALSHLEEFPYLQGYEEWVQKLLDCRQVNVVFENGGELLWTLDVGDFRDSLSHPPAPELIYFDLYSPKKCPHLWGVETFRCLYEKALPRKNQGLSTLLITYSASTAVRTALLLSQFCVGYGTATSDKKDTTLASTLEQDVKQPLDLSWFEKWKRSGKPYPYGFQSSDREDLLSQLSKLLEKK